MNHVLVLIGIFHYVIPRGYEMSTSLLDILSIILLPLMFLEL